MTNETTPDIEGDLYENCCPHCGFCGDEHKVPCADCLSLAVYANHPADVPAFTHDDDEHCVFLGHFQARDLYVHHAGIPTYVARYGNEGEEYMSGAVFVGRDPHITEAHRLATERGIALDKVGDDLTHASWGPKTRMGRTDNTPAI